MCFTWKSERWRIVRRWKRGEKEATLTDTAAMPKNKTQECAYIHEKYLKTGSWP